MSKRRKKNCRDKPSPSEAAAPRRFHGVATALVTALIVIVLGLWWWNFNSTQELSAANPAVAGSQSEFQKLTGRWQRPDGGYVLAIKSIASSGATDAAYFNPNPIHVAKAEVSRDADATKVFIELRDVNYPGSTYTLTYEPSSDQLKGIYYQAVEQQRFQVIFERIK